MKELIRRWSLVIGVVLSLICVVAILRVPAAALEWKWPHSLTVQTSAIGSSAYATVIAWGPVLEQMTGMKVRVMPEGNHPLRSRWLKEGRVSLDMETIDGVGGYTMMGVGEYATREGGPFQIRAIWLGQSMSFGFMVRGDSEIKTVYDIKPGHRIAYFTPPAGAVANVDGMLAWAKVDKKDIKVIPFTSWPAEQKSVLEGQADVSFAVPTTPVAFEVAAGPHGVRWLPLPYDKDPEGAKRFLKVSPTATFGINRQGVKESLGIPMLVHPNYLWARKELDPELAYNLAKWFHKNFDVYKVKNKNCELMSIDLFRESLDFIFLPVHEGTIKYLKEIGKWSAKDDARQEYNLNLLTRYVTAYEAAIAEADKKQIKIDPRNKEWLELWNSFKKDIPKIEVMFKIP
jgi:TRAP transporter TAXI family solute receptor